MAHRHGVFNYACNRHTWGSPNSAGENYAGIPFLLAITGLSLFIAPKKLGRPKGSKDSYERTVFVHKLGDRPPPVNRQRFEKECRAGLHTVHP